MNIRPLIAAILALTLAGCASSERMMRTSGGVLQEYSAPQKERLTSGKFPVANPAKAVQSERDRLQAALKEKQIPSMVYYPKPMHLQTAFQSLLPGALPCPVAERLCDVVLSLPMHPYLTIEEIDEVCDVVRQTLAR